MYFCYANHLIFKKILEHAVNLSFILTPLLVTDIKTHGTHKHRTAKALNLEEVERITNGGHELF